MAGASTGTPEPRPNLPSAGAGAGVGHEARAGARGAASGVNIAQNRAIGQADPIGDHRPGAADRADTAHPGAGEPGDGEGTDASQRREAGER